ncbi:MAG: glycoside hydrolase family 55 protein [Planctomycetota bacterium]|nr:glycoside hydrolase family 55 protein [Planctomycetota bacterium]
MLGAPAAALEESPPAAPAIIESAGILNVRDFGAVGDGVTDDTAAIQAALSQGLDGHRLVYVPNGTYLVSDSLRWHRKGYNLEQVNGWGAFLQLQGQSRDGTVIKLKDHAPGFTDPTQPRALVATGSRGYHGNKKYRNGEGNEAFGNHIRHLTLDVGAGNAGAIGLDYQVSNCGALRDVAIVAGPDSGFVGISLLRRDNGPGVIAQVSVTGFAIGLRAEQQICQMVLEQVHMTGQRERAIDAGNAVLALRRVSIRGAMPTAIRLGGLGHVTLLESSIVNEAGTGAAAIEAPVSAVLVAVHVTTEGFASAVRQGDQAQAAPMPKVWLSHRAVGEGAYQDSLLREPEETPAVPAYTEDDVVWVDKFMGVGASWMDLSDPNTDTALLEEAFQTGNSVVCLPWGNLRLNRTVTVPAHVRWIIGYGAGLTAVGALKNDRGPLLRFAGGTDGDVTILDRVATGGAGCVVSHADARSVVLRDVLGFSGGVYTAEAGAGRLFIDDVSGGGYQLQPSQSVYARNWDAEGAHAGYASIFAPAAQVWCLGYKIEGDSCALELTKGSTAVMLGGLLYTFGPSKRPAFVSSDSTLVASFANACFVEGGHYSTFLREGQVDVISDDMLDSRGVGKQAALLVHGAE